MLTNQQAAPSPPILDGFDPFSVEQAAAIIQGGGIVVIPTDTVYGIAAALDQPVALARIFRSKGRPDDRTLPILLAGAADVHRIAAPVPARVGELMERFWPGSLTIVLPALDGLPRQVVASDGSAGVRVPANAIARHILNCCGGALAVTSANRSGMPAAVDATAAAAALGRGVDAVLDGGPAPVGVASTIVRIAGNDLEILRIGAIDPPAIWEAWGA